MTFYRISDEKKQKTKNLNVRQKINNLEQTRKKNLFLLGKFEPHKTTLTKFNWMWLEKF